MQAAARIIHPIQRVGMRFTDAWRLDTLLGVGGTAAVYAATHRTGSRFALKVLHPELSRVPEALLRFRREAYSADRIRHPAVVPVLDDGVGADGCAFLVMELLEGMSLEEMVSGGGPPCSTEEALEIVDVLLDVLAVAHDAGVIHRDIKPGNLFETRSGAIKVLDFGTARLLARHLPATQTGMALGTPQYMAPEQARGDSKGVDGRVDIWAAGATLGALLLRRHLRPARLTNAAILEAMTVPLPSLGRLAPGLSASVVALVDQAVAFDPAARFPSARAMQMALRRAKGPSSRITPLRPPADAAEPHDDPATVIRSPSGALLLGLRLPTPAALDTRSIATPLEPMVPSASPPEDTEPPCDASTWTSTAPLAERPFQRASPANRATITATKSESLHTQPSFRARARRRVFTGALLVLVSCAGVLGGRKLAEWRARTIGEAQPASSSAASAK